MVEEIEENIKLNQASDEKDMSLKIPREKTNCYVIMPFSESSPEHDETYWTDHFDNFLKPIIEDDEKFFAQRSEPLRENIAREIINNLYSSPIVIADLTDYNPNVFWELGVRQSYKNGTITIAEKETLLPFHISYKGTLFYSKNKEKDLKFKQQLKKALIDCISNPSVSDSIVLESLIGRGTLFQTFFREETLRRVESLVNECIYNQNLFSHALSKAIENSVKKFRLKKFGVLPLLRNTSIDLLISNRYIEADNEFYIIAETYWTILASINKNLENWNGNSSWTGKNLIFLISEAKPIIEKFLENLQQKKEEITSI